jgi:hypothetical protein
MVDRPRLLHLSVLPSNRGGRWLLSALFVSEVLFATATEDEIQPIVDGLAFDEALLGWLGRLGGGLMAVAATWLVAWLSWRPQIAQPATSGCRSWPCTTRGGSPSPSARTPTTFATRTSRGGPGAGLAGAGCVDAT